MTNTYDRIWMPMPGPSSGVPNEGRRDPDATPVSATNEPTTAFCSGR